MVTKEWVEKKVEPARRKADLLEKIGTCQRVGGAIARVGAWAGVTYAICQAVNPGIERIFGGIIFGSLTSPILMMGYTNQEYNNYERAAMDLRYKTEKIIRKLKY